MILKNTISMLILFCSNLLLGQTTDVSILYLDKVEMLSFDGVNPSMIPRIKAMMSKKKKIFSFTQHDGHSLYRFADNNDQIVDFGNLQISNIDDYYYKSVDCNQFDAVQSINDVEYHVVDVIPTLEWNLENGQSRVLNYNVYTATTPGDCILGATFDTIKVWFTTEIPISNGPYLFQGLPGMILKVEMSNWQVKRTIEAKEIVLNKTMKVIKPTIKADKEVGLDELCQINNKFKGEQIAKGKFHKKK